MESALLQVSQGLGSTFNMETRHEFHAEKSLTTGNQAKSQRPPSVRTTQMFTVCGPFGRLHLASTVTRGSDPEEELDTERQELRDTVQTTFSFHPSQWLLTFGVNFGIQVVLSKSFRGLDCRLTTYRAVPDNAIIFQLCERGESEAIQGLFDAGQASPWDTNSKGFSPLFVSFFFHCNSHALSS